MTGGTEHTSTRPLVVYVEDDANNRIVFEQAFGRDFDVVTASDAPSAIALLETREAAVLLTDMQMPGLSGEDLLRITRERHPRTIRIVVTAYSDVDRILRVLNDGLVARYIIKPWEHAELVQVLRWACEAWSLAGETDGLHHRLAETEQLVRNVRSWLHDLRTPLTTVLANAEHLGGLAHAAPALRAAVEKAHLDREHRRELLHILDELSPIAQDLAAATTDLDELIARLHPWPEVVPGMPAFVDPLAIVRHAISVCEPLAAQLSASLAYAGPGKLPHVRISASELTQVLINLVANGAHAVAARGRAGAVSIHAHEREGMLDLEVHDDGVGMAPVAVERVGTPFYTTRDGCAGLGVAECRRLVARAGGRLQIDSSSAVGTTVTISLPLAAVADR